MMKPILFEMPKAPTSREDYIALLDLTIALADSLIAQLDEIEGLIVQSERLAA